MPISGTSARAMSSIRTARLLIVPSPGAVIAVRESRHAALASSAVPRDTAAWCISRIWPACATLFFALDRLDCARPTSAVISSTRWREMSPENPSASTRCFIASARVRASVAASSVDCATSTPSVSAAT